MVLRVEDYLNRLKPARRGSVREYFTEQLNSALNHHEVIAENGTFQYLVDMLVHYIETERFFERSSNEKLGNHYIVDLYIRYQSAGSEEKKAILKRLGDIYLLISGYFAASISRSKWMT